MACRFCGQENWLGWDERIALDHVVGSRSVDRGTEAFPLTCSNCGFIRLQSCACVGRSTVAVAPGGAFAGLTRSSALAFAARAQLGCIQRERVPVADSRLPYPFMSS